MSVYIEWHIGWETGASLKPQLKYYDAVVLSKHKHTDDNIRFPQPITINREKWANITFLLILCDLRWVSVLNPLVWLNSNVVSRFNCRRLQEITERENGYLGLLWSCQLPGSWSSEVHLIGRAPCLTSSYAGKHRHLPGRPDILRSPTHLQMYSAPVELDQQLI